MVPLYRMHKMNSLVDYAASGSVPGGAEESEWFWLPPGEPIPGKTYRADGWVYRDLPQMAPEYFAQLIELIGADNIAWITRATYANGYQRGQMLVSPDGMARVRAHNAAGNEGRQAEVTKHNPKGE